MRGSPAETGRGRWAVWIAVAVTAVAFFYIVVSPLFRPRGELLWGRYRLTDVYAAIPLTAAALCAVVVATAPAGRRRPVAVRALAVAIAVVPTIFLVDIAYTVAQPQFREPDFWLDGGEIDRATSVPDPVLGFVRKPQISFVREASGDARAVSYRTDENGFRNAPGTTSADVVFIGDSFTEAGWIPEEQSFVGRVAERTGLHVVNLGRGAYGPQQESIVLERFAFAYRPRFVVWQLFEGNDLTDARKFAGWRADPRPPAQSFKARYAQNSLIYRLLEPTEILPPSGRVPIVIRFRDGVEQRKELRYRFAPDQVEMMPEAFAEMRTAIERGARLCAEHGARLIIVFVPTMVQVLEPFIAFDRPEDRERALPGGAVRSDGDLGNRLSAVCGQPMCTFVDLFEELRIRALADNTRVYDRNDPDEHLDVDGHDAVSRAIVEALRRERNPVAAPDPGGPASPAPSAREVGG